MSSDEIEGSIIIVEEARVRIRRLPIYPWGFYGLISDLEAITTTNKRTQKEIDEAIKHVSRSLDAALWAGAARLDTKHGNKVFDDEKKAVKHLMKITEGKGEHADPAIVGDVGSNRQTDRSRWAACSSCSQRC